MVQGAPARKALSRSGFCDFIRRNVHHSCASIACASRVSRRKLSRCGRAEVDSVYGRRSPNPHRRDARARSRGAPRVIRNHFTYPCTQIFRKSTFNFARLNNALRGDRDLSVAQA
ncbi:hypothetical protein EVAR_76505_1 [Eumeta japonica]|uniref:Uncharacterized protein n=1 Tax=Eumeta variegata TaxID=151549 RepID=A0A4C1T861_EUMVA|nr:hypothetical protein EVAR_76505_1 [Eumeta japonica]